MAKKPKAQEVAERRVTEQYILDQVNYHYDSESFRQHKDRMEQGDKLYKGDLAGLFPDETSLPNISLVENKFKNALHDISRLAAEGKGAVKAIARGDKESDMRSARVRESIAEGYWRFNRMHRMERKLYLDLAGGGMMGLACYYDATSSYPQITRLDPRFCYPDVRNGNLRSLVVIEEVKERILGWEFPDLGLDTKPTNDRVALFACYYDANEVAEAVILRENDIPKEAKIVKRWQHGLGRIPVAFEMMDTYDGAFHGLFEQLAGPLMVRNKVVRFLADYLESIAHAPLVAEGVINADDEPGPTTVYQLDPNAERTSLQRLAAASTSGDLWRLLSYLQDQEEKESIQPPSRVGNVSQSIASGSFVDRTQGQLTSVVNECQDKMSSLREQVNEICFAIDEAHLDSTKPLVRPVAGKKTYKPSDDIGGWYFHEVKFGATAGVGPLNAEARVLNLLAARVISRMEARAEVDFLDDEASSQDKADEEALADAILQRFVRDPNTAMSAIVQTWLLMKRDGKSFDEALAKTKPDLVQQQPEQAGTPTEPLAEPGAGGPSELARVNLPMPPLLQGFNRTG